MLTISTIVSREKMYQFFASIFLKEPSDALLRGINETLPLLSEALLDGEAKDRLEGLLSEYMDGKKGLMEWKQDYYDLFFVPVSGRYAPAIESVQMEGKLWGEAEREMAERYRRAWFYPEDLEIYDPIKALKMADFLGLELAYLAHLCNMETYSGMEMREKIEAEERETIMLHLLPWIKRYRPLFMKAGEDTLYAPMLRFIELFLEQERQLLASIGGMKYV